MKNDIPKRVLCKRLPRCFRNFFDYVGKLGFTQKPNYKLLKRYFRTTLLKVSKGRFQFDWYRATFAKNSKVLSIHHNTRKKIKKISSGLLNIASPVIKQARSTRDLRQLLDNNKPSGKKPPKSPDRLDSRKVLSPRRRK
jgi:hypothetical protein